MVSYRFYVLSFIMIFLFFGLGIIIGNSLGGQWVDDSYQNVLAKLEDRLTRLSLEKAGLQEQLRQIMKSQQELNQAWLSFFKEKFGSDFSMKKGILVQPEAMEEAAWVKSLKEMGLSIELISDSSKIRWPETDYLILYHPEDGLLQWVSQQIPPALPVVLIGTQRSPALPGHHFLVIPYPPQSAKDLISLVEGIQLLLRNPQADPEPLSAGGRDLQ